MSLTVFEAKQNEHKLLLDNDVDDLIDMRTHSARNFVKGRWALSVKETKMDSSFSARPEGSLRVVRASAS